MIDGPFCVEADALASTAAAPADAGRIGGMTLPTAAPLPADDAQRRVVHNEVHARPPASIELPARVLYVAVLNDGVTREAECAHLRRLPGHERLSVTDLDDSFLRLALPGGSLKWERHTEFTRYSFTFALPAGASLDDVLDAPLPAIAPDWLGAIPGRTICAIRLRLLTGAVDDPAAVVESARAGFGGRPLIAAMLGHGGSVIVTDFHLGDDGFEHMLVIAPPATSPTRAGRIASRLLEIETYRLMALRGLPVAKALGPVLAEAESALADITARLERKSDGDQALLDGLVGLAARVERATAEHMYRFSATQAYDALVRQRIDELHEVPVSGAQRIGEFMRRRMSPAIATVGATAQRLVSLSQRVERAGALLRTRVDIAAEAHNQQLLEKLTRGQAMQLRLQSTVEGLSIAAISYYVVSLVLYAAKAAKAAGWPVQPEIAAGGSIPLVLLGVAALTRHIRRKLHD